MPAFKCEDALGFTNYEDWFHDTFPEPHDDDHVGEISEADRHLLECHDIVGYLGELSEMRFRTGRLGTSVNWYLNGDLEQILEHAKLLMDPDLLHDLERDEAHWPPSAEDPRAIRFIERHPHFWLAVGLVAGALMREKTLHGTQVEAIGRSARNGSSRAPRSRDPSLSG